MEITTRQMEAGEAAEVKKIGQKAFAGVEGLWVPKPKQAIVAVKEGKIVGAIQCKIHQIGKQKAGYYDYAFIASECRNQGVGTILYKAAADYFWEQGCTVLTALVKDDNVGSWSLFQKNGFKRSSFADMVKQFGTFGALRLYIGTLIGVANGMDYYVAMRDPNGQSEVKGGAGHIIVYLLLNLILALPWVVLGGSSLVTFFTAYAILLIGVCAFGFVGTLFSKRKWKFRLCLGGGLICFVISMVGSIYPMIGNWYPEQYENSDSFRKDMGIQALTSWLFVLVLTVGAGMAGDRNVLFPLLSNLGSILLLFRVIPIYPFEAFGGGRILQWNKGIYLLMAVFSLGVFIFI